MCIITICAIFPTCGHLEPIFSVSRCSHALTSQPPLRYCNRACRPPIVIGRFHPTSSRCSFCSRCQHCDNSGVPQDPDQDRSSSSSSNSNSNSPISLSSIPDRTTLPSLNLFRMLNPFISLFSPICNMEVNPLVSPAWRDLIHASLHATEELQARCLYTWFPRSDARSRWQHVEWQRAVNANVMDMEVLVMRDCEGDGCPVGCACGGLCHRLEEGEEGEAMDEEGEDRAYAELETQYVPYPPHRTFTPPGLGSNIFLPLESDLIPPFRVDDFPRPHPPGYQALHSHPPFPLPLPLSPSPRPPINPHPAPIPITALLFASPRPTTETALIRRWVDIALEVPCAETAGVQFMLDVVRERELRGEGELGLAECMEDAGVDLDWVLDRGLYPDERDV